MSSLEGGLDVFSLSYSRPQPPPSGKSADAPATCCGHWPMSETPALSYWNLGGSSMPRIQQLLFLFIPLLRSRSSVQWLDTILSQLLTLYVQYCFPAFGIVTSTVLKGTVTTVYRELRRVETRLQRSVLINYLVWNLKGHPTGGA